MKIKEALIESIHQLDTNEDSPVFTWSIIEMSQFYVYLAVLLLEKDMPNARFGGEETGGKGIPFKKVTAMDSLRVLGREDPMRYTSLFMQSLGFF